MYGITRAELMHYKALKRLKKQLSHFQNDMILSGHVSFLPEHVQTSFFALADENNELTNWETENLG